MSGALRANGLGLRGLSVRRSFVLAAMALCLAGCTRPPQSRAVADPGAAREQSVEELVDRGRAFAVVGDLTRGEQYLSAALRRGADPLRVLPMLVHVCVAGARYRVASEYVRGYLLKDPENARLHLLYGLFEAAVGDRDLALREYESVLRLNPGDPEGHFALGVLLRDSKGDLSSARAQFRDYLRLLPDGAHAEEARASLGEDAP